MKSLLLACLSTAFWLTSCTEKHSSIANDTLWYNYPANYWNSQALHLGDGFIGASFFGGVEKETFALTEGSMWTGGPFRGDWEEYGVNPKAKEALIKIRNAVQHGNIHKADSLSESDYLGKMDRFGHFTSIGDLFLEMDNHQQKYTNYTRKLDLANSIGSVNYFLDGISFEREYFCSYPNKVLVIKLRADEPSSVGFKLGMDILQDKYQLNISENSYTVKGIINQGDERTFQVSVKAVPYGGKSVSNGSFLEIHSADSVVLYLCAATDYKQKFPDYRGIDPAISCENIMNEAQNLGYALLKKRHIQDYTSLYNRVSLNLDGDPELEALPTNERWERLKQGKKDTGLKELAFKLGRYLIISSSRPGSLPANLQGKWNTFFSPPWTGNYQANINIQEIYWPCGPVNLIECQEPYIAWTKDLVKSGEIMAEKVYGTDGWISHTIGNIWGHTAPVGGIPWGVYPLAPVWHCQHLWEQYNFTMDTNYLRETAYPIIKQAALFWMENLIDYQGYLIAAPSISAEHGSYITKDETKTTWSTDSYNSICYNIPGPAQDAQMIGDLFNMCIKSSVILNTDDAFRDSVKQYYSKLVPPQIGQFGQLREWYEDIDSPDDIHRHIAHLYAVCPGNSIHPLTTPALAEAAKVSLNMRGEGRFLDTEVAAGGNWSLAWRIWCWTRLMDGDRANRIFTEMITNEGFENLTTYQHAPYGEAGEDVFMEDDTMYLHFQLDASASTPGFMAEMLLQSHLDEILLLPALPSAWENGEVKGLKARGGYTIDISWKNGILEKAKILSSNDKIPKVRVVETPVDVLKDKRITFKKI